MIKSGAKLKRFLGPDEAEFVVLWLDLGHSLEEVGEAMGMTIAHVRCYLQSRPETRTARRRLEQRVAFQRVG